MSDAWLHIVGIGEDGMDGLTAEARALVGDAEVIVGGDRHHTLAANMTAIRIAWGSRIMPTICAGSRSDGRNCFGPLA